MFGLFRLGGDRPADLVPLLPPADHQRGVRRLRPGGRLPRDAAAGLLVGMPDGGRCCWSGTARRRSVPTTTTCCRRPAGRRAGCWARWLAERGVTPTVVSSAATCAGTARPPTAMAEGAGWSGVEPRSTRAGTSSTTSAWWRRVPRPAAAPSSWTDRRAFQRLFEEATARWTAGEHDADYAETWPPSSPGSAAALDRAPACGRPGRHGRGGQLRRPDRRRLRGARRPRGGRPRGSPGSGRGFNTVIVNSSVTRVVVGSTGPRLLTFNEHPHLEGDHLTYR